MDITKTITPQEVNMAYHKLVQNTEGSLEDSPRHCSFLLSTSHILGYLTSK